MKIQTDFRTCHDNSKTLLASLIPEPQTPYKSVIFKSLKCSMYCKTNKQTNTNKQTKHKRKRLLKYNYADVEFKCYPSTPCQYEQVFSSTVGFMPVLGEIK